MYGSFASPKTYMSQRDVSFVLGIMTRYWGQKPLSFLPSCPISWLLSRILDDVQLLLPNIEP